MNVAFLNPLDKHDSDMRWLRLLVVALWLFRSPPACSPTRKCVCSPSRLRRARRGCAPRCWCHNLKHSKCPDADYCIGRCGRLTTAGESSACGYCAHCAADPRWVRVA